MRFRTVTLLDDLIGGLVADTRRELLSKHDPLALETPYNRIFRSSACAIVEELSRPISLLPDFLSSRTDFGERKKAAPMENFWAMHLTEGTLRNRLPMDDGYDWPRCLGWAHQTVIESTMAELREEGIL